MQQRQLRLGDILDDYCPRERRLANHTIVAMVGDDIRLTRCTTCDTEHPYKGGKVPRLRKKKTSVEAAYDEVLESVKCLDEGVLTGPADGNIGSLFGIGFPAWTGGVLQFVETYPGGVRGFVDRATELGAAYGERFTPPASLLARC